MKKIVMGIAAAALATSMFAGEPASNPSVASFNGNASVEWGVDLDTNKTGFKNDTWSEFKMKLFDTGTKETSGDGIWAELKIKIEDDDGVGPNGVNNGAFKGKAAAVDTAKFHINNFYIGIMSGDTQVGELDLNTALRSAGFWANNGRWLSAVGTNYGQGIVAGYADGNLEVNVDFRSDAHYTNNYAMAAEAKLKDSNEFAPGLEVKGGFAYGFETEYYPYSASASYKANIDDTYYVKPAVGITGTKADDSMLLAGALLFGWGGTNGYASVNLPYFTDDSSRGMTPGVSVAFGMPLVEDAGIVLIPSLYLGDLVENMKAAVYSEIGMQKDIDTMFAIGAGVSYDVKSDDVTITPKFALRYENEAYAADLSPKCDGNAKDNMFAGKTAGAEFLDMTVAVDIAGLINNTTFTVEYVSGNLSATDPVKGTLNCRAKIAF